MIDFLGQYQTIIHYSFHFIIPAFLAFVFFKKIWKKAWLIMIATMIVDLDHLFANPIFDPERCSIGFHFLHTPYAIGIYFLMLFVPNKYFKVVGIGLLFHMLTDYIDCLLM